MARAVSPGRREIELATRWAEGAWVGQTLWTEQGDRLTVVYQGRRGGPAGPDFRDVVLLRPDGCRIYGDVELHLRASGWRAHGHGSDPRYNGVVLHVVLARPGGQQPRETLLASGASAPIAVVADTPRREQERRAEQQRWPCAGLRDGRSTAQIRSLLQEAGRQRFALRVQSLQRELAIATADADDASTPARLWTPADRVLWAALAEGLGYGRDRETLREMGEHLGRGAAPEALAEWMHELPAVERTRAQGLLRLRERWLRVGPWLGLKSCFVADDLIDDSARRLIDTLRVGGGSISRQRAAIILANVVLPFAVAWATLEGDEELMRRAEAVYGALPGLQSNQITRLMARHLGLARLPAGATAQLGLHHIWGEHCRQKLCGDCPCGVSPRLADAPV